MDLLLVSNHFGLPVLSITNCKLPGRKLLGFPLRQTMHDMQSLSLCPFPQTMFVADLAALL